MSFEEFGRAMDALTENLVTSVGKTMRRFSRSLQLIAPHPTAEGRRLTEDLCREDYDIVERNDVRVERVSAENHTGDAADVRYHDGTDWSEVTRYDLAAIERSVEDHDA